MVLDVLLLKSCQNVAFSGQRLQSEYCDLLHAICIVSFPLKQNAAVAEVSMNDPSKTTMAVPIMIAAVSIDLSYFGLHC